MTQNSVESSVLFSLAELQRMEQDRRGAEEHERAAARARRERERRDAEAERNRIAQAELASERAATEERARREAETRVRERAREQAALEVARIEAAAKVKLVADEQMRTREFASVQTHAYAGLFRICLGLSVTLGLVLCAAAFSAWRVSTELDQAKRAALQSRQEREAIVRDRETISNELDRARGDWGSRLQAANAELLACQTRGSDQRQNTPPPQVVNRPPPSEPNLPVVPCKEGDPLCDASRQPR